MKYHEIFKLTLSYTRVRLRDWDWEIGLEFNQSEERKLISTLVNFALIGSNSNRISISSLMGIIFDTFFLRFFLFYSIFYF